MRLQASDFLKGARDLIIGRPSESMKSAFWNVLYWSWAQCALKRAIDTEVSPLMGIDCFIYSQLWFCITHNTV